MKLCLNYKFNLAEEMVKLTSIGMLLNKLKYTLKRKCVVSMVELWIFRIFVVISKNKHDN